MATPSPTGGSQTTLDRRRHWMSELACARAEDLDAVWRAAAPPVPAYDRIRGPETGMVMTRGRAGGTGDRFNLGEMTVTRCSVRLADGTVGHAYVAGRDGRHAERAALLDALLQTDALHDRMAQAVVAPLAARRAERHARTRDKAARTRVAFFTLVRGEDE